MTANHIDQYKELHLKLMRCNGHIEFQSLADETSWFFGTLYNKFMTGELTEIQVNGYMDELEHLVHEIRQSLLK